MRRAGSSSAFDHHLSEAGVGSVSEIFDAEPPYTPRGCISAGVERGRGAARVEQTQRLDRCSRGASDAYAMVASKNRHN